MPVGLCSSLRGELVLPGDIAPGDGLTSCPGVPCPFRLRSQGPHSILRCSPVLLRCPWPDCPLSSVSLDLPPVLTPISYPLGLGHTCCVHTWRTPSPKHLLCKDSLETSGKGGGALYIPRPEQEPLLLVPCLCVWVPPAPLSVSVSPHKPGTPCFSENGGGNECIRMGTWGAVLMEG